MYNDWIFNGHLYERKEVLFISSMLNESTNIDKVINNPQRFVANLLGVKSNKLAKDKNSYYKENIHITLQDGSNVKGVLRLSNHKVDIGNWIKTNTQTKIKNNRIRTNFKFPYGISIIFNEQQRINNDKPYSFGVVEIYEYIMPTKDYTRKELISIATQIKQNVLTGWNYQTTLNGVSANIITNIGNGDGKAIGNIVNSVYNNKIDAISNISNRNNRYHIVPTNISNEYGETDYISEATISRIVREVLKEEKWGDDWFKALPPQDRSKLKKEYEEYSKTTNDPNYFDFICGDYDFVHYDGDENGEPLVKRISKRIFEGEEPIQHPYKVSYRGRYNPNTKYNQTITLPISEQELQEVNYMLYSNGQDGLQEGMNYCSDEVRDLVFKYMDVCANPRAKADRRTIINVKIVG